MIFTRSPSGVEQGVRRVVVLIWLEFVVVVVGVVVEQKGLRGDNDKNEAALLGDKLDLPEKWAQNKICLTIWAFSELRKTIFDSHWYFLVEWCHQPTHNKIL
jgi:hypothetical protein